MFPEKTLFDVRHDLLTMVKIVVTVMLGGIEFSAELDTEHYEEFKNDRDFRFSWKKYIDIDGERLDPFYVELMQIMFRIDRKIDGIRILRHETSLGLLEAKNLAEFIARM